MINEYLKQAVLPRLAETGHYARLTAITNLVTRMQDDDGRPARQSFPVACNVNGSDVWNTGAYRIFVPDDSVQSIGFFENGSYTIQDMQDRQSQQATFLLKFLAWYNLRRMGVSDCNTPYNVLTDTMDALSTNETTHKPFPSAYAVSQVSLIQDNNPQAAFSKYSFAQQDGLFLYPYSFAAFDVRVIIRYKKSCIPSAPEVTVCNCQIF